MAVVQKTYAELGDLWGVSKDAARKKVEGLRLPRKPGNDGKTRVTLDLTEVTHHPMRPRPETGEKPHGDRAETVPVGRQEDDGRPAPETIALHGQIAALEARMGDLHASLERERLERDRERKELTEERDKERTERFAERDRADQAHVRADRIAAELHAISLRFAGSIAEAQGREAILAEKLEAVRSEMAALRSRPWWKRLAG